MHDATLAGHLLVPAQQVKVIVCLLECVTTNWVVGLGMVDTSFLPSL
jgi:hypothetical protein